MKTNNISIKKVSLFLLVASVAIYSLNVNCAAALAAESDSDAAESTRIYYKDLSSRLRKGWWVPPDLLMKPVQVRMVISKDGQLSSVSIAKSSGSGRADSLALIGVKRSAPFAALPEGLPVPFTLLYTLGYASHDDKNILYYNGKRYEKEQAIKLSSGSSLQAHEEKMSDLDKQFHAKKEAALLKMNQLDTALAEEDKASEPTAKKANLLVEYANCLISIQEPAEAKIKLTQALAILQNSKAEAPDQYNCLSQLAQLDYTIGDYTSAEPLLQKAMAIVESSAGAAKYPDYKSLLETYAKLLYKLNRVPDADAIYKKIKSLG